jgi:hypothetical protein
MLEAVGLDSLTVVWSQVKVCADLHLVGKKFIKSLPKEHVNDLFDPERLELRPEMERIVFAVGEF